MTFDLGLIRASLPDVLSGMAITLYLWLGGTVLAFLLGFALAILRRSCGRALGAVLWGWVAVFRGTPFLIQIFLLYFGGPYMGLDLDPIPAGLLGLTLYGSAYFAETIRGGFESIPKGHVEAAICLGLTRGQIVRRVMLPEMALLVLPSLANITIEMMKETAVLSIITVPELTMTLTAIGSANFAFAEAAFMLALGYWLMVEAIGTGARGLERRLHRYRIAG